MNKDEERLRRAKRTGKYFDTSTSKPKNLWLNNIFPIILLISLMLYIYMEVIYIMRLHSLFFYEETIQSLTINITITRS